MTDKEADKDIMTTRRTTRWTRYIKRGRTKRHTKQTKNETNKWVETKRLTNKKTRKALRLKEQKTMEKDIQVKKVNLNIK